MSQYVKFCRFYLYLRLNIHVVKNCNKKSINANCFKPLGNMDKLKADLE